MLNKSLYDLINENKIFVGYAIIGTIATFVDFAFLYSFVEFFKLWYIYSAIFSFLIAAFVNFYLNRKFNFKNKNRRFFLQFLIFLIFAIIGAVLNIFILYIFTEFFKMWYISSKVISTGFVFIINYIFNKYITFRVLK
jgi:putative flippase GtrA